ncbi:MAG: putative toxin-antitoxin system toxin component, PIN family [Bacteroidota bacterium]
MRVLIDSNLWISALISRSMRVRIERLIADDRLEILADAKLFTEIEEVAARPKFSKYLNAPLVSDFIQILRERVLIVETKSEVHVCRDPNDDFLLAICLDGDAEYLISGDSDLLSIGLFSKTQILSLTEFEEILSIIP